MKKLLKRKALLGFTLIELVIVIVILGILVAAAIPKYKDLQFESQQSATFSSLGSLRSSSTIYLSKNSTHSPPMIVSSGANGVQCTACTGGVAGASNTVDFFPSYIQKIPANDVLDEYGGTAGTEDEIKVYTPTATSLLTSTSLWLGTSACEGGINSNPARASTGKVDEASGWLYAAEPATGSSGGGGEGFDWRINIQDCIRDTNVGYYDK